VQHRQKDYPSKQHKKGNQEVAIGGNRPNPFTKVQVAASSELFKPYISSTSLSTEWNRCYIVSCQGTDSYLHWSGLLATDSEQSKVAE
jgi:hypothetical protein